MNPKSDNTKRYRIKLHKEDAHINAKKWIESIVWTHIDWIRFRNDDGKEYCFFADGMKKEVGKSKWTKIA